MSSAFAPTSPPYFCIILVWFLNIIPHILRFVKRKSPCFPSIILSILIKNPSILQFSPPDSCIFALRLPRQPAKDGIKAALARMAAAFGRAVDQNGIFSDHLDIAPVDDTVVFSAQQDCRQSFIWFCTLE